MTISVTKITACAFDMRHMVRRPPKFQRERLGMFPAKFRQHKASQTSGTRSGFWRQGR